MLHHPCILGDPQTKGDKIGGGCLTLAFSGAQKRPEMLRHPCILRHAKTKGDKIRISFLTLAFSGAQKRAEMLHHPCILGDPQTNGDKILSGCLTPRFSGLQKRFITPAFSEIPKQRATKSQVATSPLPSWGAQNRPEMLHHPCILRDP